MARSPFVVVEAIPPFAAGLFPTIKQWEWISGGGMKQWAAASVIVRKDVH